MVGASCEVYRGLQLVLKSFKEVVFKNYWTFGRKNRMEGQEKGNTT